MAPKAMKKPAAAAAAMKRPAAAAEVATASAAKRPAVAGGVAKKPAAAGAVSSKGNGVTKTCALVSKALADVPGYSQDVLSMLCTTLPQCLGMPKEERHGFQARIVEMIGEVLGSSEAQLQAELAAADEGFGKAQAEKASKDSEEAAGVTTVEEKAKAEEAAEIALRDSEAALDVAKVASAQAHDEQKTGDASLEAAAGKLAALKETKVSAFDALKDGTATQAQASIKALLKFGKDFSFDVSLINALPCAMSKGPSERSVFDGLVLEQTEKEFRRCTESLEETLATGDSAKNERAAKVASASSDLEKAKEAEQACKDALKAAKAEKKEAEAARKAAKQAAHALGPELKKTSSKHEKASAALEAFRTGPLAAFQELVERSAELPPPPAEEESAPMAAEGDAAQGEAPAEPAAPAGEAAAAE